MIFEDHGLRQIDEAGKNQAEGGRTKGEIITSKKLFDMYVKSGPKLYYEGSDPVM